MPMSLVVTDSGDAISPSCLSTSSGDDVRAETLIQIKINVGINSVMFTNYSTNFIISFQNEFVDNTVLCHIEGLKEFKYSEK